MVGDALGYPSLAWNQGIEDEAQLPPGSLWGSPRDTWTDSDANVDASMDLKYNDRIIYIQYIYMCIYMYIYIVCIYILYICIYIVCIYIYVTSILYDVRWYKIYDNTRLKNHGFRINKNHRKKTQLSSHDGIEEDHGA